MGKRSAFPLLNQVRKSNVLNLVVASLLMSDSTAHLKMIQMKSTSTSHQHSHSRCTIVFCINILTPCFFRAGHVTCSGHTTLDGGALRHAPLRLLDLESLCSGRSDQSDWLYQVRPGSDKSQLFISTRSNVEKSKGLFAWVFILAAKKNGKK